MVKFLKKIFGLLNLEVRRKQLPVAPSAYFRNQEMFAGMQRIIGSLQPQINTVIDVGAAEGSWSLTAKELWPDAQFLLFEPLTERAAELNKVCLANPGFQFVSMAAGKEASNLNFAVSADLDGSGVAEGTQHKGEIRAVEVTSIAAEINKLNLPGPYLIKLDTHGYEVPIIEGCTSLLENVSLFIIECYGFRIAKDSLLFWEMCSYMNEKGFGLIDIVDVARRPADKAFWQCDAFFIPKTSAQFSNNTFLGQ